MSKKDIKSVPCSWLDQRPHSYTKHESSQEQKGTGEAVQGLHMKQMVCGPECNHYKYLRASYS